MPRAKDADTGEFDPARLFTDPIKKHLAGPRGLLGSDKLSVLPIVVPTFLVGRNITSDSQAADDIIDTSSRLKVAVNASAVTQGWLADPSVLFDSGSQGGTTAFVFALALGTIVVVDEIWYTAQCDATVATRTAAVFVQLPLASATGVAAGTAGEIWRSATLTMTASEEGSIWGNQNNSTVNDNGTKAVANNTTAPTPFPFLATGTLNINVAEAAFVAGDAHRLVVVGRVVA